MKCDYCDVDYASDSDTRRPISGLCIFLNGNLITWSSKKQPCVSRSSVEAEYRALVSLAKEIRWATFIYRDLTYPIYHTLQSIVITIQPYLWPII